MNALDKIVEEVLAVGDTEFQRKYLGKMGVFAHQDRTVLVVIHNMGSIVDLYSLRGGVERVASRV